MAKRRKRSGAKRTITPEQQAKMQEGRKKAAVHKQRVSQLYETGVAVRDKEETRTQRMLNSVRRAR